MTVINVEEDELEDYISSWGDEFIHVSHSADIAFVLWPNHTGSFEWLDDIEDLDERIESMSMERQTHWVTCDDLNYYCHVKRF